MTWQPIETAPENVVVRTKIDDANGARNVQRLKRKGRLWWMPDGAMYVYYTPTHWQSLPTPPSSEQGEGCWESRSRVRSAAPHRTMAWGKSSTANFMASRSSTSQSGARKATPRSRTCRRTRHLLNGIRASPMEGRTNERRTNCRSYVQHQLHVGRDVHLLFRARTMTSPSLSDWMAGVVLFVVVMMLAMA